MSSILRQWILVAGAGLLVVASLVASGPVAAQSSDDLVKALSGHTTRAFDAGGDAAAAANRALIDSLRNRGTRQIRVEERAAVAAIVKQDELPSVDLEIYFDFNSAAITREALPDLVKLGQALSDERLAGATFVVAGHTDATGRAAYNQRLSERRAAAVKDFLVSAYKLDPSHLIAVGYGEEELKNPDDPAGGENRRVQVVNLAGY